MDLRDLMNNDAAPARPPSQHSTSQRGSFPPPPPLHAQRSSSGTYPPLQHQHQQQQQQQQQPPPPPPQQYYQPRTQAPQYQHDPRPSNASMPSTPMALHTPQQQYSGAQYPFPQQQQQQQHSPSQNYPQVTPRQQSHPQYPHSMSPTPPGAHRSPIVYPPPHSQPSTPLGPPMQPYNRQPSTVQAQHQRATSGASYALQHHHSITSQSPIHHLPPQTGYPPASPQSYAKRPSLDYPTNTSERDRSVSVSPKTKVVLPTRQNSTDSSWMNRERYASNEPRATNRSSGDQAISPLTTTKQSSKVSPSQPRIGSQTPGGFRNILNDDPNQQSPLMVSSPAAARGHSIPPPPQYSHLHHSQSSMSNGSPVQPSEPRPSLKQEPQPALTSESLLQQPIAQSMLQPALSPQQPQSASQPTLKRPAESEPERMNPAKKTKRRYAQPPVWARYAPPNPRYDAEVAKALGPPPNSSHVKRQSPRPALQVVTPQQQQRQIPNQTQPNGHAPPPVANGHGQPNPSRQHPPVSWEPSIRGGDLFNPFSHQICSFLYEEMASKSDIGVGDTRNGALEIEAKLGRLIDKSTEQRVNLPVITPTVLARGISHNLRFESHMNESQHKIMNEFLNACVSRSHEPGRVKMEYKHRYEVDSFAQLNQAGYDALPQSAKNYLDAARQRALRLRTTVNARAPAGSDPIIARIVKVRLADLDIFCPGLPFDCRISMNVEVDMHNRPDIDPTLIVDEGEAKNGGERSKDRLSYKHLAYSVDLTQVTGADGRKLHELEIEVDAIKLRREAEMDQAAFGETVQGLINNIFVLLKGPAQAR